MHLLNKFLILGLALSTTCYVYAGGTTKATLNLKATVKADCSISISPETLDFGDINGSEIGRMSSGEEISGHERKLTIQPECYGTDSFNIDFFTANWDGEFSKACPTDTKDNKNIKFCIRDLYFTGGGSMRLEKKGAGNSPFDLTFFLERGTNKNVVVGQHEATMSLTISPK
ncbi:hypothetical protein [Enterobacter ludwigii]